MYRLIAFKTMKRVVFSLVVVTAIAVSTAIMGCKKEKPESEEVVASPEYVGVIDFGEQYDFAILGKDGSGYFYEFQDEKPIPERLSIYDGNKREVNMVFNFDEDGLPKTIISKDFTVVLGNYTGNRFDAVIITKDDERHIFENIETDIYWDDYKNDLNDLLSEVKSSTIVRKSSIGKWINKNIVKPAVKSVNTISSAVACGVGIGVSTTGVGAIVGVPLALYGCTNMVLNGLELLDDLGVIDYESPEFVNAIRTNGGDMFQNCATMVLTGGAWGGAGCVISGATMIKNGLDSIENRKKEDIIIGDLLLQSNNIFEIFDELGIEINRGINPPQIEGTYFISPLVLVSSNFADSYSPGYRFADMQLSFSEQNNNNLSIACSYISGTQIANGLGAFITGEGNKFSVYVETSGTISGHPFKSVEIYSGEITYSAIKNFQFVMIVTQEAPTSMKKGQGRFFIDQDGFSEKILGQKSQNSKIISDLSDETGLLPAGVQSTFK